MVALAYLLGVFIVLQTSCSHFNMRAYKSFKDKNQHLFAVSKM